MKTNINLSLLRTLTTIMLIFFIVSSNGSVSKKKKNQVLSYPIVDTGVSTFYNNLNKINEPGLGDPFYGQDAQYSNHTPEYKDNGDGTITDLVTGLMWQQKLLPQKMTYQEALKGAKEFKLGGYNDWRLPTIKELYSLIMFYGTDPSGEKNAQDNSFQPFINTDFFDFRYGNIANQERVIDAQYVSSTLYTSTTMWENKTVFGVNFADGRIKGYPISSPRGEKKFEVLYVRENPEYGKNKFIDNKDNTITDKATGLMWSQYDSEKGMSWQDALMWVQNKNKENYLGYNDWRLPNAKELQSIVDYSQSPDATDSPAINNIFHCTDILNSNNYKDYPYYWTSTTHVNSFGYGSSAVYICFGRGLGWMWNHKTRKYELLDVHGAGCQRSDPKSGRPDHFPYGHGPQGDVVNILNFVRCVRTVN